MKCCSCPPFLEAATHLLCVVCGVTSSSYGCLTFSLYLLTVCDRMAERIEELEEVSVAVVW